MISIWPESASEMQKAKSLADRLGAPLVQTPSIGEFCLKVSPDRLELFEIANEKKPTGGISADFCTGPMKQLVKSAGRGQPLAKALGLSTSKMQIVDATAGLGKDSLFLASLGCDVVAVERNPVIFALLEDGLLRAHDDEDVGEIVKTRILLVNADATDYLSSLPQSEAPGAVYIDPMFPENKKSALPKKEMQIFRSFLKADMDSRRLLDVALKVATSRVVVKRPSWAKPLLEPIQHRFDGKLVSFDSYLSSVAKARYI